MKSALLKIALAGFCSLVLAIIKVLFGFEVAVIAALAVISAMLIRMER